MLTRAATELEAANEALGLLGEARLSSLTEARLAARVIKDHFGTARDAVLRMTDWNFARTRATLAADPQAPAGPFALAYPLPEDAIRVLAVEGADEDSWSVDSGDDGTTTAAGLNSVLYTDLTAPVVIYTRRVDVPARWDALFLRVFALELAAAAAPRLGHSTDAADSLRTRAKQELATARRLSRREAARSQVTRDVPFVTVRR